MKTYFSDKNFSSPKALFSPKNVSYISPSKFSLSNKNVKLNRSIENLQEKMSQAKARLLRNHNNDENYLITEFELTNEKFKRMEIDNNNLKTQIDELKYEIENHRFSEKLGNPNQQVTFEKTNSFRLLSNEIEDLTKQLEMKNLENLFNEKKFIQNFNKIQQAYNMTNEKIIKFQQLGKLYEKKIVDLTKRKKQLKESVKLKDMRIQDLEKENNELQMKFNSKNIFSSMEVNYGQLISLQKENSELKSHLNILEKECQISKDRLTHFDRNENNAGSAKKKGNCLANGLENFLIEQLSLMILTKSGNKRMQDETKKNLKENFGEKFVDTIEKYFHKLNNAEIKNKKYVQALIANLQREILLSEEFKIILQLIFKTADELSSIFDVSELDNEKFQEIRKRFINYKSNYNLRFINLLQEINERQFELNNITKETSGDNELAEIDEYAILVKNNELIKTKLENLQFQNSQLRVQLNNLENDDNQNKFMKTPKKTRSFDKIQQCDEIDKNSLYLMMTTQASLLENFINEKVL